MARVLRGEIVWVDFGEPRGHEQGGHRPALVVQDDALNKSGTTIVLAITSRAPRVGYPLAIGLRHGEGGLPRDSWIKTNQIRLVSDERITGRLGKLEAAQMRNVEDALLDVLGIDAQTL